MRHQEHRQRRIVAAAGTRHGGATASIWAAESHSRTMESQAPLNANGPGDIDVELSCPTTWRFRHMPNQRPLLSTRPVPRSGADRDVDHLELVAAAGQLEHL